MLERRRVPIDDPRIDAALDSFPAAELPAGFMRRMREHLEAEARAGRARMPAARSPQGFAFLDLSVTICAAMTFASVVALGAWMVQQFGPGLAGQLDLAMQATWLDLTTWRDLTTGLPLPALGLSIVLGMLSAIAAVGLLALEDRPVLSR